MPNAGPALPMCPMRPASRANRCWRTSCARQRSLIDTYRFSAHPDIRMEIKIVVATQPIERKRIDYSRTFAAPRKLAEARLSEYPKKKLLFFTEISARG